MATPRERSGKNASIDEHIEAKISYRNDVAARERIMKKASERRIVHVETDGSYKIDVTGNHRSTTNGDGNIWSETIRAAPFLTNPRVGCAVAAATIEGTKFDDAERCEEAKTEINTNFEEVEEMVGSEEFWDNNSMNHNGLISTEMEEERGDDGLYWHGEEEGEEVTKLSKEVKENGDSLEEGEGEGEREGEGEEEEEGERERKREEKREGEDDNGVTDAGGEEIEKSDRKKRFEKAALSFVSSNPWQTRLQLFVDNNCSLFVFLEDPGKSDVSMEIGPGHYELWEKFRAMANTILKEVEKMSGFHFESEEGMERKFLNQALSLVRSDDEQRLRLIAMLKGRENFSDFRIMMARRNEVLEKLDLLDNSGGVSSTNFSSSRYTTPVATPSATPRLARHGSASRLLTPKRIRSFAQRGIQISADSTRKRPNLLVKRTDGKTSDEKISKKLDGKSYAALERQLNTMKKRFLCVCCLEEERTTALIPCGHHTRKRRRLDKSKSGPFIVEIVVKRAFELVKHGLDFGDPYCIVSRGTRKFLSRKIKFIREDHCEWVELQRARFFVPNGEENVMFHFQLKNSNKTWNIKESYGKAKASIPPKLFSGVQKRVEVTLDLKPGKLVVDFEIIAEKDVRLAFWHRVLCAVDSNSDGKFSQGELVNLLLLLGNYGKSSSKSGQSTCSSSSSSNNNILDGGSGKRSRADSETIAETRNALENSDFDSIEIEQLGFVLEVDTIILEKAKNVINFSKTPLPSIHKCAMALASSRDELVNLKKCPITSHNLESYPDEFSRICYLISSMEVASNGDSMSSKSIIEEATSQGASWLVHVPYDHAKQVGKPYRVACSIIDRETGEVFPEFVPAKIWSTLLLCYASRHYRLIRHVVERSAKQITKRFGQKFRNKNVNVAKSQYLINAFIKTYKIDMTEYVESDPTKYRTMNDFFIRKVKPEKRPIAGLHNSKVIVSAADCRFLCFPSVNDATRMWIKGSLFSIKNLLGPKCMEESKEFQNCALCIFRLAPQDYHRIHIPISGILKKTVEIPGWYHSVNPICVNHKDVNVFTENHRVVNFIETEAFEKICVINIGATVVGSIVQLFKPGDFLRKGDCFGYYQYGGSTTVMLVKKNHVKFDSDLLKSSADNVETRIRFGMQIGVSKV
eukprot:g2035.t1